MINKKNLLGKRPEELGAKDAIHTAIVAVRAGGPIEPGQRCGLNEFREAIPNPKGPGVADPFVKGTIMTGQSFWLLLAQDEVPNVQHVWQHPDLDFSPPTRETVKNELLEEIAGTLRVTYEQLMAACAHAAENNDPATYPGTLSEEELDEAWVRVDTYDLWAQWSEEASFEFENEGSACCPEYCYPECELFKVREPQPA